MKNYNLDEIAEWAIGDNQYNREEILNLPGYYLVVEIRSNHPSVLKCERLPNGQMEQRQFSMFRMIENLCSKHQIPDLVFGYCGHDRSPDTNGPFFTHSRIRGTRGRNILAPCFTFYGYPEKDPEIIKEYSQTWNELIDSDLRRETHWEHKEDSCVFVGTISEYNNRLDNTTLSLDFGLDLSLINQSADSSNFISRESLSKYKFLLHLNGNGGAYASRFKYLLGTEGLVIYNYNSGSQTNFWEEWWMKEDVFLDGFHFISVPDKIECVEKLKYYFENQGQAAEIASNGFSFFKEFLTPETIEKYWVSLLSSYAKKLK
jgi:hypothetical protein